MQVVTFAPADAAAKTFVLSDIDGNRNGDVRAVIKTGSNFDGKTLTLQVQHPTNQDWYETGMSFAAVTDAAVGLLKANYTYRLSASAYGGNLAVSFMFF